MQDGNTECAELLIAVIQPRFQSVIQSTIVCPPVQLNSLCVYHQAALEKDLCRIAQTEPVRASAWV